MPTRASTRSRGGRKSQQTAVKQEPGRATAQSKRKTPTESSSVSSSAATVAVTPSSTSKRAKRYPSEKVLSTDNHPSNSLYLDDEGEEEEDDMILITSGDSKKKNKQHQIKQEEKGGGKEFLDTCHFVKSPSRVSEPPKNEDATEQKLHDLEVAQAAAGYFYRLDENEIQEHVQARKCAFDAAWAVVERAVSKVMQRVNEHCFQQIHEFIRTPQSRKQLPVALIQTGVNVGDRSLLFSHLHEWLNHHMEGVVVNLNRTRLASLAEALRYVNQICLSFMMSKKNLVKEAIRSFHRRDEWNESRKAMLDIVMTDMQWVDQETEKLAHGKYSGLTDSDKIVLWVTSVGYKLKRCVRILCDIEDCHSNSETTSYPLVLLLEGIENPQSSIFQLLIERLSAAWFRASHLEDGNGYESKLNPIRIVLPLAGTSETFHQQTSMNIVRRLSIVNINLENPLTSIHQLVHHLMILGKLPVSCSPRTLIWLLEYIIQYGLSVRAFLICVHYLLVERYSTNKFSFLGSFIPSVPSCSSKSPFRPSEVVRSDGEYLNPFSSLSKEALESFSLYFKHPGSSRVYEWPDWLCIPANSTNGQGTRTSDWSDWRCVPVNSIHTRTATWRTLASRVNSLSESDIRELFQYHSMLGTSRQCKKTIWEMVGKVQAANSEVSKILQKPDIEKGSNRIAQEGASNSGKSTARSSRRASKGLALKGIQDHLRAPTPDDMYLDGTPFLWPLGYLPTVDVPFASSSGQEGITDSKRIKVCTFLFRLHRRRIVLPYILRVLAFLCYECDEVKDITNDKLRNIYSCGDAKTLISSPMFLRAIKKVQIYSQERKLSTLLTYMEKILMEDAMEHISLSELGWMTSLEPMEKSSLLSDELSSLELIRRKIENLEEPTIVRTNGNERNGPVKHPSAAMKRKNALQPAVAQNPDVDLVTCFLKKIVLNYFSPIEELPLHELATAVSERSLAKVFTAQPREVILRSLENHQLYLPSTPDITSDVNDTVLAFQVYRYASRKISIYEWYLGFRSIFYPDGKDPALHLSNSLLDKRRKGSSKKGRKRRLNRNSDVADDDADDIETELPEISADEERAVKIRFVHAVNELRWMGFIEHNKHNIDSVNRLVFDVRHW